jgi:hypothetical protein
MEKMNNVIIDRVEKGKSGEAAWGKWQAWSIWFVGLQPKFDYFERDNVVPFPGMQVILAEYTMVQSGQYTNYKLKKLVPAQLAGPHVLPDPPVQAPLGEVNVLKPDLKPSSFAPIVTAYEMEKRLTMCTSYAKDLMVEVLHDGSYREKSFKAIIELVAEGGKLLAKKLGEKLDVVPVPGVTMQPPQPREFVESIPIIPGPPVLIPEVVVSPKMAKAVNEVLVTPAVLPTPKENIPNDDVPF